MAEAGTEQVRAQQIEQNILEIAVDVRSFTMEQALVTEIMGVIDKEKIIVLFPQRFYIEKKLPFHILIIKVPFTVGTPGPGA